MAAGDISDEPPVLDEPHAKRRARGQLDLGATAT
jgi:hypothetical protein